MGILLKGCRISKSWSPLTIQDAPAVTASSRNLLSLGSRQSENFSTGSIEMELEMIFSMKTDARN